MKTLLAFLVLALATPLARAAVLVKPMFMYSSTTTDQTSYSGTYTRIDLGYLSAKGWFYGGSFLNAGGTLPGISAATNSYGPTFGWTSIREFGPYLFAHYYIPQKDMRLANSKRSGWAADLGYKLLLRRYTFVVEVSYRGESIKSDITTLSFRYIEPSFGLFLTF